METTGSRFFSPARISSSASRSLRVSTRIAGEPPHWRRCLRHLRIRRDVDAPDAALTEAFVVLKWIVGSKVDHPLADPKQARALIAELPPHDSIKALEEITRWLESLTEVEGL